MKAKKRKSTVCSNCDSALDESYNFCPTCGQSNSDNNITFWILIKEFLDNYLGIDSKMAHSFLPFLLRPGSLTNRFQEGKIKHFIHPVRLYLVLSLFYFFIISFLLSDINFASLSENDGTVSTDLDGLRYNDDLQNISDSLKISFLPDSIQARYPEIKEYNVMYDSIKARFGEEYTDNTRVNLLNELTSNADGRPYIERMHMLARDSRISDDVFMDSLRNGGEGDFNFNFINEENTAHVKTQIRKIFKNDEGFKGFLLGNLPLMMFILIPLFAGVLKMIYIRRTHLYIKHIVHALHVHSFAYLMYGISLLIMFKLVDSSTARGILAAVFFVGVSTYVYVSFLKVYKQGWLKTLIKFNIVGFVYSIFLQIFFYLSIFISFWYYNG